MSGENNLYTARHRGRQSFWQGRAIYANPFVGDAADEWRIGYRDGAAEYATATKARKSPETLAQFRPIDMAELAPWRRMTHSAAARGTKAGWRMPGRCRTGRNGNGPRAI